MPQIRLAVLKPPPVPGFYVDVSRMFRPSIPYKRLGFERICEQDIAELLKVLVNNLNNLFNIHKN